TGSRETYLCFKDWPELRKGALRPDYVLYDLKSRYPLLGPRKMKEIHDWMTASRDYRLIYSKDGYFLYERADQWRPARRTASPTPSSITPAAMATMMTRRL